MTRSLLGSVTGRSALTWSAVTAEPLVVKGTPDAYRMPQYRVQLTDDEIAQVLTFVRSAWGNGAASVTADQVKALRPVTDPSSDRVIILKMR